MKSLILAIALLSSINVVARNRESGGRRGPSAVYVYFFSYGTGIDAKSIEKYDKLVAKAKAQGLVIDEKEERRGREGETLTCVQFNSPFAPHSFVKALAPSILADTKASGIKRTSVYVGADCDDVNAASEQDLAKYVNR